MDLPRKALCVLAIAALPLRLLLAADDIQVGVEANRNQIYKGESLVMTLRVSGADQGIVPDLSAIPNATVRPLESHSDSRISIVTVNGRTQRDVFVGRVFTYEIVPQTTGSFTAGPIRIRVGNRTIEAAGPRIEVSGIEQQDDVILEIAASRDSVLVDEPFEIRLSLFLKRLANIEADPILPGDPPHLNVPFLNPEPVDGLELPDIRGILQSRVTGNRQAPGFLINQYTIQKDPFDPDSFFDFDGMMRPTPAKFSLERRDALRAGVAYYEYRVALRYVPRKEGPYTFGPAVFKGKAITGVDASGNIRAKPVFAVGAAAVVRVVPPPDDGRPASYVGIIGSNLTAEAALDAQTCKVGDPLQLTLTLKGAANFDNLTPPLLSLQTNLTRHFRLYDDSVQCRAIPGGRTCVYTVRPTTVGTIEWPPVELAYYDAGSRAYRVIRTPSLPVHVQASMAVGEDMIVSSATNRVSIRAGKAGGAAHPAPITVVPEGALPASLFPGPWSLVLVALGPCALALLDGSRWLRRHLPGYRRRQRRQNALRKAQDTLRVLESSDDPRGVARRLHECIATFVADRLDLPALTLMPDDLARYLPRIVPDTLQAQALRDVAERSFNAAFTDTVPTLDQVRAECRTVRTCLAAVPDSTHSQETAS